MPTSPTPVQAPATRSETEHFGALLGETSRIWRTLLDERLKMLGLSQAKWLALLHIHRGGQALTQKELATRLGVEGATLTALLDRLMRDDYIERREAARDRRSKTVHLTPKAQQVMKQITAVAAQLRRELLTDIPERDLGICIRTLKRIQETAASLGKARRQATSK
jgi:MarR family transcriptional regulator, transcriptional regulator for hemolysin